jgi:hypothetical protein
MKKLIGLIVITIVFFAVLSLAVHTIDHGRCADAHPISKTK